jgi:hypothetical protein
MKTTLLELVQSDVPTVPKSTAWARNNTDKAAEQQRKTRNTLRGSINGKVSAARQRAKNKGKDFDIDIDFVQSLWESQGGLCALTGKKMGLRADKNSQESFSSFSIDRIDSSKGYTKDNVQLIMWGVNCMKSNMDMKLFFDFVSMVHTFNDLGEKE